MKTLQEGGVWTKTRQGQNPFPIPILSLALVNAFSHPKHCHQPITKLAEGWRAQAKNPPKQQGRKPFISYNLHLIDDARRIARLSSIVI